MSKIRQLIFWQKKNWEKSRGGRKRSEIIYLAGTGNKIVIFITTINLFPDTGFNLFLFIFQNLRIFQQLIPAECPESLPCHERNRDRTRWGRRGKDGGKFLTEYGFSFTKQVEERPFFRFMGHKGQKSDIPMSNQL